MFIFFLDSKRFCPEVSLQQIKLEAKKQNNFGNIVSSEVQLELQCNTFLSFKNYLGKFWDSVLIISIRTYLVLTCIYTNLFPILVNTKEHIFIVHM